jgi:hypothetical protein
MRVTDVFTNIPAQLTIASIGTYAVTYAFTNTNPLIGPGLFYSNILTIKALERLFPKIPAIIHTVVGLFLSPAFTCLACNLLNLPITFKACLLLQGEILLIAAWLAALTFVATMVGFIVVPLIVKAADIPSRHFFNFRLYDYLDYKLTIWFYTYIAHPPQTNERSIIIE